MQTPLKKNPPLLLNPDAAIITRAVSKQYGTLTALDSFNLEVSKGEIFALLGPNGAGKTTLIRILTTLMRPTSASQRSGQCSHPWFGCF